jgi:hypothetical protein
VRGNSVFRLLAATPAANQSRTYLQYLWAKNVPQRRTRRLQLHCLGAPRTRLNCLRRVPADPILLCGRFDRRGCPAYGGARGDYGADQYRQPDRIQHHRARRNGHQSCRSRSRIIRRPLPENDPKQPQPDISMAQKLLDSRPHVPLKAGLVKTVEYFENLLADHSLRDQLSNEART